MRIAPHDVGQIGRVMAPLAFQEAASRESAVRTVRAGLEAGVRFIDTALAYTRPGETSWAEEAVREALKTVPDADRPVVATKGGHWRDRSSFPVDGRPETLRAHCHTSLRALGVDVLDLYQLHHVDPVVPLAESVGALEDLRREGLIRLVGLSNVGVEQIAEAREVAPISSVQNRLSIAVRDDLPTAEVCARSGIGYLAYKPLTSAQGDPSIPAGVALCAVARQRGVSPQQVALAWLRQQAPSILPLVGSTRPATIQDSAASGALTLTLAELNALE